MRTAYYIWNQQLKDFVKVFKGEIERLLKEDKIEIFMPMDFSKTELYRPKVLNKPKESLKL